jgi:hypothetical protein
MAGSLYVGVEELLRAEAVNGLLLGQIAAFRSDAVCLFAVWELGDGAGAQWRGEALPLDERPEDGHSRNDWIEKGHHEIC